MILPEAKFEKMVTGGLSSQKLTGVDKGFEKDKIKEKVVDLVLNTIP